jgi:ubiquinone/menaquinone biosynthesis C-methylase UbiE
MDEEQLIESQVAYYRARAGEYDQWFLRQGRYDRGPEHRTKWLHELAIVQAALRTEVRNGEVLEVACGTGLWTCHLAESNTRSWP